MASIHLAKMYECYTELHNIADAKYHGGLAFQFSPEPENVREANNLGYLFTTLGDLGKAKILFEAAQKRVSILPNDLPIYFLDNIDDFWDGMEELVNYNLGIVYAMQNDCDKAIECLTLSIEKSEKREDHECACLFVPKITGNKLEFSEVFNPDLLLTAKSSIKTIKQYRKKTST